MFSSNPELNKKRTEELDSELKKSETLCLEVEALLKQLKEKNIVPSLTEHKKIETKQELKEDKLSWKFVDKMIEFGEIKEGNEYEVEEKVLKIKKNIKRSVWDVEYEGKEAVLKIDVHKGELETYEKLERVGSVPNVFAVFYSKQRSPDKSLTVVLEKLQPFVYSATNAGKAFSSLSNWSSNDLKHSDISPGNIMMREIGDDKDTEVVFIDPNFDYGYTVFFSSGGKSKERDRDSLARVLFYLKNRKKIERRNRELIEKLMDEPYIKYIELELIYTYQWLHEKESYRDNDSIIIFLECKEVEARLKPVKEVVEELKIGEEKMNLILDAFTYDKYPEMVEINKRIDKVKYNTRAKLEELLEDDMDYFLFHLFANGL